MASDSSSPRALPAGSPGRFGSVRHELLHTLAGRMLVIGGAVKLFTWLLRVAGGIDIALVDAVGSIGSVGVVAGVAYFLYRLIVRAKRRLLWRVRRKLILSYIFVGFVPVLLVVAFFLLAGLLLFLNVGSYLVANSIRTMADDARFQARQTALEIARAGSANVREILARQGQGLAQHYPGASLAVVPTSAEPCAGPAAIAEPRGARAAAAVAARPIDVITVGPWAHLAPPRVLPSWVSCAGFADLIAVSVPGTSTAESSGEGIGLVVRAVGLPDASRPTFAVIADIPLDTETKAKIRDETSVKIDRVNLIPTPGEVARPATEVGPKAETLLGRLTDDTQRKQRFQSFALLNWVDWPSGASAEAVMWIEVNVADIYDRVSAGQARFGARTWGSLILVVLAGLAILFVIIEVVALIMGLILARSITGSVHQLFAGTERVRQGDFGHKIRIATHDQMGELAESFNSMTASIEDLLRQAEEKKRLEEELRIARAIQMSLLPRGELAVPGLSITALCVPAREVGGDYYDLLPLDERRLGVLIADVAGKGTSAALYMAELKGLILSLSRIHQSPRQLLIEANRIIADNLDSRSFITMTYAIIDLQAHTMIYARAGHTPLIHCTTTAIGPDVRVLAPDGLVVGLQMDDGGALFERLLKEETITFREGDLFMFFTDGITEAMNAASDCFGEARLSDILAEHATMPSEQLRERILREIDAFVAGAPQHDDMTMILVKVDALALAPDWPPAFARFAAAAQ
jgi:sigma-B regulation protein RsbU (phosphoserine phosphatase)